MWMLDCDVIGTDKRTDHYFYQHSKIEKDGNEESEQQFHGLYREFYKKP